MTLLRRDRKVAHERRQSWTTSESDMKMKTLNGIVITVVGALVVSYAAIKANEATLNSLPTPTTVAAPLSSAPTLMDAQTTFIKSVLSKSDAHARAQQVGSSLEINYRLDPWMLTASVGKSSFTVHMKDIIPAAFSKFPEVNSITIIATCGTKDKRGHEGRADCMRTTFTRENSASIVWKNISYGDLPQLADAFWQANGF